MTAVTAVNGTRVELDDQPAEACAADPTADAAAPTADTTDSAETVAEAGTQAEPEPETGIGTKTKAQAEGEAEAAAPLARRGGRLAVLMVVAAVGLGGLGTWFTLEARQARSTAAAANTALVDTGATAEVSAAITNSLNRIFSYSYDKPDATEEAASEALRGPALDTYHRLFAQVRELAPQQKIVLTTRVVHIAVQSLTGERAQLLVFLDQSATRADNNTTSTGAAQLSVTAEKQGDSWVIIDLTPR